MRIAVILDAVAAGDDFAAQFGMRPGAVADAEETGLGAGGIELVEDARGDFRVGAVVDGQGDFAAFDGGGRQARQVGTEQ